MIYGCIGEKLSHSFSKEIHAKVADYDYELCEIKREDLASLFSTADFRAINVTIPYKEEVIPYLHEIDSHALEIGAVNTVVNRDGKLYGYNTDFFGMSALIERCGVSLFGKKVAILGTGGTSRTAAAVARSMGAKDIIRVSRSKRDGTVTYPELYGDHTDTEVIINTTPVGMYPENGGSSCDISHFPRLALCIDAVYNPLRSRFILSAMERGIPAEGGLYMLVAQAVRASEIFLGKAYAPDIIELIYNAILSEKENTVLIGMPASGKSTVGGIISRTTKKELIDTDELIVKKAGVQIKEIFDKIGECGFRDLESEAVAEASKQTSVIIATGGGAILREENVRALKQNGRLFFIDRPLKDLIPTESRPLSSNINDLEKRFYERYPIYTSVCDEKIDADGDAATVARLIMEKKAL